MWVLPIPFVLYKEKGAVYLFRGFISRFIWESLVRGDNFSRQPLIYSSVVIKTIGLGLVYEVMFQSNCILQAHYHLTNSYLYRKHLPLLLNANTSNIESWPGNRFCITSRLRRSYDRLCNELVTSFVSRFLIDDTPTTKPTVD